MRDYVFGYFVLVKDLLESYKEVWAGHKPFPNLGPKVWPRRTHMLKSAIAWHPLHDKRVLNLSFPHVFLYCTLRCLRRPAGAFTQCSEILVYTVRHESQEEK